MIVKFIYNYTSVAAIVSNRLKSHLFRAYLCCDYAVITPVLQQYNNNISSLIHVFDMYNIPFSPPFHYFFMAEKRCLYYVMSFRLRRKHNAITS